MESKLRPPVSRRIRSAVLLFSREKFRAASAIDAGNQSLVMVKKPAR
jgi:hypothetical protein